MPEHNYKFDVKMHCSGCSGAVEKVLKATEGITYNVSLEKQTVEVSTDEVPYETVLEKIKKTGKPVTAGEKDGESADI
ncbi:Cytosolic copper metallochaperone [Peltigera leucophlebia]|nr:Cytosolic copper metallochaperone [Peltigera leucophlebia]